MANRMRDISLNDLMKLMGQAQPGSVGEASAEFNRRQFCITLHGAGGGELDWREVDAKTDEALREAVIDFIRDVEILRDGDVIRIEAQSGERFAA